MKREVYFCGHAVNDETRACVAPVSFHSDASLAFFCAQCGLAQKEAADAVRNSSAKRPRVLCQEATVGTCETCFSFGVVGPAKHSGTGRVCAACDDTWLCNGGKFIKGFNSIYWKGDILKLTSKSAWHCVFPQNYSVIVIDVPWQHVKGNTSQRIEKFSVVPNADLLQRAADVWSYAFQPSDDEPLGLAVFWCTSDTRDIALQAMRLAGYTFLHTATWLKLKEDQQPWSYKAYAVSNMEIAVFGSKGKRVHKKTVHYVDRCFFGQRFVYVHSSKPLAFYDYLKWWIDSFFEEEICYNKCHKLELFARYAHESWTCTGDDFRGFRSSNGEVRDKKGTVIEKGVK